MVKGQCVKVWKGQYVASHRCTLGINGQRAIMHSSRAWVQMVKGRMSRSVESIDVLGTNGQGLVQLEKLVLKSFGES